MKKREESLVLSKKVRSLREERGWTRAQLAFKCGYSENWLVHVEIGDTLVSLTALYALAKALGVTAADLLTNDLEVAEAKGQADYIIKFIRQYKLTTDDIIKWIKIGRLIFAGRDEK